METPDKDTSLIGTLSLVPKAQIMYKITSDIRTLLIAPKVSPLERQPPLNVL
jgi:hypothetical protein